MRIKELIIDLIYKLTLNPSLEKRGTFLIAI